MTLITAVKYRLSYQFKSLLYFFGYLAFFSILFPVIGILASGSAESIRSDILFASVIYFWVIAFVGAASDFKLFIQNSVSRFTIFWSNIISTLIISVITSVILRLIVKTLDGLVIKNLSVSLKLVDIYTNGHTVTSLTFLTVLLIFASTLGSLAGTFNDRFSNTVKILVILGLIMVPSVIGISLNLLGAEIRLHLLNMLKFIVGYSKDGMNVLPILLTLLVLIGMNSLLTFLLNRKREIKRVNA